MLTLLRYACVISACCASLTLAHSLSKSQLQVIKGILGDIRSADDDVDAIQEKTLSYDDILVEGKLECVFT